MQTDNYKMKIETNNAVNTALDSNAKPTVEKPKSAFGGGFSMKAAEAAPKEKVEPVA